MAQTDETEEEYVYPHTPATQNRYAAQVNSRRQAAKGKAPRERVPVANDKTPLGEWLEVVGMSQAEFGRRVGVSHQTVMLWSRGQHLPSLVVAFLIERETDGKVPVESWLQTVAGVADYNRLTSNSVDSELRPRRTRGRQRRA